MRAPPLAGCAALVVLLLPAAVQAQRPAACAFAGLTEDAPVPNLSAKALRDCADALAASSASGNIAGAVLGPSPNAPTVASLLSGGTPLTGLAVAGPLTIPVSPVGNYLPTLASLNVRGRTTRADIREFAGVFGLTSTTGAGYSGPNSNDKVALYAGAEGFAGTANLWGANISVARQPASGDWTVQGLEVDVNEANADTWGTNWPSAGVNVTSGSTYPIAYAFTVGSTTAANAPHVGFYSAGTLTADFFVQGASPDVILVGGTHQHGLNTTNAALPYPLIMATGQALGWLDVAGSHIYSLTERTTDNRFALVRDGVDLFTVSTTGDLIAPKLETNYLGVAGNMAASGSVNAAGAITGATIVATGIIANPSYTKANLPACLPGWTAYVSDGRNTGEAAGAGTGTLAYCNGRHAWYANGAPVAN